MVEAGGAMLAALLRESQRVLAQAGIEGARLEARLLVEHFTHTTRTQILTEPDMPIDHERRSAVDDAIARRMSGEPVHRIIGIRSFYGMDFRLSAATLEPRQDTETLVDAVLPFARAVVAHAGACRILDLGTGTGAIALALLTHVPEALAIGTDISSGALDAAARNAAALGLDRRYAIVQSDWFETVTGRFDLIVSNPPYIRSGAIAGLDALVRDHDPLIALDGGSDGLDAYRAIADGARRFLEPDGFVGLEIGFDQKDHVVTLFARKGFLLLSARRDLCGNDRALVFGLNGHRVDDVQIPLGNDVE